MTTRWQPDTCECVFDIADDGKSAKTQRACEHHKAAPDPWLAVKNENTFKNMVVSYVMDMHPGVPVSCTYALGGLALYIDLSADDKASLQTELDQHFGADEVSVQAQAGITATPD